MRVEPHDPLSDEHHLISVLSPVRFAAAGRFQISLELEVGTETLTRDLRFPVGSPDFQPI